MPHSNRRHHVSNFNSIFDHILSDSHLYMINQEELAKMVIFKKLQTLNLIITARKNQN